MYIILFIRFVSARLIDVLSPDDIILINPELIKEKFISKFLKDRPPSPALLAVMQITLLLPDQYKEQAEGRGGSKHQNNLFLYRNWPVLVIAYFQFVGMNYSTSTFMITVNPLLPEFFFVVFSEHSLR